jgi:hypothetical protein
MKRGKRSGMPSQRPTLIQSYTICIAGCGKTKVSSRIEYTTYLTILTLNKLTLFNNYSFKTATNLYIKKLRNEFKEARKYLPSRDGRADDYGIVLRPRRGREIHELVLFTLSSTRIINIQAEMAQRCIELLAFKTDEPKFILDIGCGSGISGEQLSESGHQWVGLDISRDMLSRLG